MFTQMYIPAFILPIGWLRGKRFQFRSWQGEQKSGHNFPQNLLEVLQGRRRCPPPCSDPDAACTRRGNTFEDMKIDIVLM